VLLVVLVGAAFAPCLENGFVSWDDEKNFLANPSYRGLGWSQIAWDWSSFQLGVYQPLAWMILGVEYVVFGLKPWGYHLASVAFHALNAVVLLALTATLLRWCRPCATAEDARAVTFGAGLAAACFAVHPLRTEVVAWASCQPYLPCALFFMLAILAYLRAAAGRPGVRGGWLAIAWLLFAAALLSKAVAVALPAVLLILDVYPLRRLGSEPGRWTSSSVRHVWWEKLPFVGLGLVFMGVAIVGRTREQDPFRIEAWGPGARLARASYGIWFYIIKSVVPINIAAYYSPPARIGLGRLPFLLSLVATIAVSAALFLLRRRWPGLLAAWLSYVVILAPNLGLVRTGIQIAADRYSYIAMIGLTVLLAAALAHAWRAAGRARCGALGLTAAGLATLAALAIATRAQCRTWRTSETLWTHALTHASGHGSLPHNNLGLALLRQGRLDEAKDHCAEALRLNSDYTDAHVNLGTILSRQGRNDEARAQFAEALRLHPDHPLARVNLGVVLLAQGQVPEALTQCAEGVRLDPANPHAHTSLGAVLYQLGRLEEAAAQYVEGLRIQPEDADAHENLATVLLRAGRLDEARTHFLEALRLRPDDADAHERLATVLARQGRLDEAAAQCREALRLDPRNADAHKNLGAICLRQGRLEEAAIELAETVRLDPNNVEALNNQAMIWAGAPEARYRDGRRAVASAARAGELTGWKNAGVLDTFAAACAESGDFQAAVEAQSKAIDLVTEETAKQDLRTRLRLYQDRQPYRLANEPQ
jgi:Flp pilus assembly protein TadD